MTFLLKITHYYKLIIISGGVFVTVFHIVSLWRAVEARVLDS